MLDEPGQVLDQFSLDSALVDVRVWGRCSLGMGTHAGDGIEGNGVATRKTAGTGPAADGHSRCSGMTVCLRSG